MQKLVAFLPLIFVISACSHGSCKTQNKGLSQNTKTSEVPVATSTSTNRVKVYKPDGTLQCGQGKLISLGEMQKQLKGIQVFSSGNKNDGMMRIQVCGSPTGNHNIYEIDRKDLEAALKAGFKEWTFE
jgi:hypothetical protein